MNLETEAEFLCCKDKKKEFKVVKRVTGGGKKAQKARICIHACPKIRANLPGPPLYLEEDFSPGETQLKVRPGNYIDTVSEIMSLGSRKWQSSS